MTSRKRPQTHMDDNVIKDADLEQLLETREELKQSASDYKAADKKAKEKIRSIEVPTPYRVGRFVIESSPSAARSVSFDTEEALRFTIKLSETEE